MFSRVPGFDHSIVEMATRMFMPYCRIVTAKLASVERKMAILVVFNVKARPMTSMTKLARLALEVL